MKEETILVEIQGAHKRFSQKNVVLKGLKMTVVQGTIYGILGPSGCGKTTLLSCVAGRLRLDAGSITVKLEGKKQIGYMPQDLALLELFTVSEMLQYFGRVNGMSSNEICIIGHELLQLMELAPDIYWKKVIANLSGGQQRRVSLAVALLHDPKLLILDEPTVGLDPLISEKLWEYFVKIIEKGKTILITTHYIQEAWRAHTVGLMRNGILLAEDAPLKLLDDFKCNNLEDVFLLLCQKQETLQDQNKEAFPKKTFIEVPLVEKSFWNFGIIRAEIYKNICWLKRNFLIMTYMLLLPGILMYTFCLVYSDVLTGVKIAVVTEDILPDSCQNPRDPDMVVPHCKPESRFSCHYMKLIAGHNYILKEYTDIDSAYNSFNQGQVKAILHFYKNYSQGLISRLTKGTHVPDGYINASMIDVFVDSTTLIIGLKIEKCIKDSFYDLGKFIAEECDFNPRAIEPVLTFQKPIYGEKSPKFRDTAMAGFIIPVAFYFTTFFSATAVGNEKMSGFLQRCLVAGVHYSQLIIAHVFAQIFMATGQNLMVFTVSYGICGLPQIGSWTLVLTFVVLIQFQGMFYGFFLGTLCEEEKNITNAAVGTVLCLFLCCGMFWPLEGAHSLVRLLTQYFPIAMAVESYRSVTLRGWGLSHSYIVKSIAANVCFIIFFISIFIIVIKTKKY